jgi:hypothetical protein
MSETNGPIGLTEITMDGFLDLVLENGLDYNVEWEEFINDGKQYIITLNNVSKIVRITFDSNQFIYLELMP